MTTPNDLRAWYDDLATTLQPGEYATRVMYAHGHQVDRRRDRDHLGKEASMTSALGEHWKTLK